MRTTKFLAGSLVMVLLLAGSMSTQAAPKNNQKPAQPIEIVADEMYFSDKTGELFAKGNVVITQDQTKIYADIIRGNDKQTEVWVDGQVRLIEPKTDLVGMKIRYNYGSKFGMMQDLSGKCGNDFVTGKRAHFENAKYTIYEATMTGCPTKGTPDYRTTARKVEIWPNDKVIAYDASVWIKNTIVYTTPRYKKSLKKIDEKDNEYPRFGYQDKDGFYIGQTFTFPLTEETSAFLDAMYYSAAGFKPTIGLQHQTSRYGIQGVYGETRDGNGNWIKKEPEFSLNLYSQKIGSTHINYSANAVYGQWTDAAKSSWHQDYSLYFSRDPIYFDQEKTWTLNLGTGFQHVRESYNNSFQNIFRYNVGLSKKISPSLTTWAAYNFTDNNNSAFAYNKIDVPQEGILGLSWKVNNRTTLSYYTSYDLANSRTYENYYTINHSFHCWETALTYRAMKQEFIWTVAIVRW